MRYLLLLVGFLSLALGLYTVCYGPTDARENGELLVVAGTIFFTGGAVAIDVVQQLKQGKNQV